ncbi:MAG: hypothetical protein GEV12_13365 [Micromonosporaceae bacterium]|nr:hypothetical protein [Micromonosporaceae bacterium]
MTRPRTVTAAAGTAPPERSTRSLLAVLLLTAVIAVNLAQFRSVDQATVDSFDAVHRNDTADIVEISYRECDWCRDRYGLHLALGMLAPGSTVIVPATSPYAESQAQAGELTLRLTAYGRVGGVDWVGYEQPPQLLSTTDVSGSVVASGPGGAKGRPWALALAPPVPDGAGPGDPDGYVARALAAGEHRHPTRPPREFVLLRWDVARDAHPYQDLLVESSLLPAAVRVELAR